MNSRSSSIKPSSRGWPADDRQQDHAERFLHLRELEEIVENDLRVLRRA